MRLEERPPALRQRLKGLPQAKRSSNEVLLKRSAPLAMNRQLIEQISGLMKMNDTKTESPQYAKMSHATAISLGLVNRRMYRGAVNRCVNLLVHYAEGCSANCAYCGLAREVWIAAHMAKTDEAINAGKITRVAVAHGAMHSFANLARGNLSKEELSTHVYELFAANAAVSKPTAAQYLACLLEALHRKGHLSPTTLRAALPRYIVSAIDYVTFQNAPMGTEGPGNKGGPTHV